MNFDRKELVESYLSVLRQLSMLHQTSSLRTKPLISSSLPFGQYSLASFASVEGGLHAVTYYVRESCGFLISVADNKAEALASARNFAKSCGHLLPAEYERHKVAVQAEKDRQERYWADMLEERRQQDNKVKSIPRRRQQIFDESDGKCHYCHTALTLDGKWHIEHKMPRALGGGNEPGNLVASCVPCNMKKRDTTDQEFKARRAREAA